MMKAEAKRLSYGDEGCISVEMEVDGKQVVGFLNEHEAAWLSGSLDVALMPEERAVFDTVACSGLAVGNDELTISQADIDAEMGEVIYKREMEV